MNIRVRLHEGDKGVSLGGKPSVRDALKELGINPETVIVKRKSEILLEEEPLEERDEIEVIRIVSGG